MSKPMSKAQKALNLTQEFLDTGFPRKELVSRIAEELPCSPSVAQAYISDSLRKLGAIPKKKAKESTPTPKTSENTVLEKATRKQSSKKTAVVKEEKKAFGPLQNMTDVRNFLMSMGKEVNDHFDGGKVICDLGEISMAFGDFFVRVPGEVDKEGRQISRVMSPAHLRRYILGDNSKIGKLEIL